MKFLLLKTLLLRKKTDEGFTLPIVIAIGLVMVLLSAVDLVQSGEENLNALSQRGSADALAMAELGVARYRDFLNNNRVLSIYNLAQWTSLDDQTCNSITATGNGWANNDNDGGSSAYNENMWRVIQVDETVAGEDLNNDGDNTDTNAEIGRYKIVNYIYDNDGNLGTSNNGDIDLTDDSTNNDGTPPLGILTVQGRNRIGSVAQLQVQIPLGVNTQDLEDLNPALWIQQNNLNVAKDPNSYVPSFGNVNVSGSNVVLSRPSGLGGCDNPENINSQNTISDSRKLPPIVDINQTGLTKRLLLSDLSSNTDPSPPTPPNPSRPNYFVNNKIVLGNSGDDSGGTQALYTVGTESRYYYHVGTSNNLDIGAGEAIVTDGTSKVILYVDGNLNIDTGSTGNRTRLVNSSHRTEVNPTATIAEINSTTPPDIGRYLEIHVKGNVNISGSGELFITGLLRVDGKITISGSSQVEVKGAIWTNQWENTSSQPVNITADDYKFFSITPERTPAPLTYRPDQWERQEASSF